MSEKLIESGTFKCAESEKLKAIAIGKTRGQNFSEYIRALVIKDISEVEVYLNTLIPVMGLTTDTEDTFRLELAPPPMRDVTPKYTGTKNAQLCDQLSIFAIHQQCDE